MDDSRIGVSDFAPGWSTNLLNRILLRRIPYPVIPLMSPNTDTAPPLGCGPQPDPNTPEFQACIRDHYSMYPVQRWFFKEALYGDQRSFGIASPGRSARSG